MLLSVKVVKVFPPPSRCHSLAVTYPRSFDADFFAPIIIIIIVSSSILLFVDDGVDTAFIASKALLSDILSAFKTPESQ